MIPIEKEIESVCKRMLHLHPDIIIFTMHVTKTVKKYFETNPLQTNYDITIVEDSTLIERTQDNDIIEMDIWIEAN